MALVPPPEVAENLTATPLPWPVVAALEMVNFSPQLAELVFSVIWCFDAEVDGALDDRAPVDNFHDVQVDGDPLALAEAVDRDAVDGAGRVRGRAGQSARPGPGLADGGAQLSVTRRAGRS